jgi:hypothetical protein
LEDAMRIILGIVIGAVLGMILLAGFPEAAARDCNATLSISQARTEPERTFTRHVFQIDVSVVEACAVVEFHVILETRKAGQETQTVKKYRKVRFRTRQLTTGHTYTADPDVDVLSWRVEQLECRECE